MTDPYAKLDRSILLKFLFHPQKRHGKPPSGAADMSITVDEGVEIVCRVYHGDSARPWIIYFHGNGEVVSDYDGIAPLYTGRGLNLFVADYRGYGASSGRPTFATMVKDAAAIFRSANTELLPEGAPSFFVMGRSLGSVSALELVSAFPDKLKGMIIESGFISVAGLIRHLGLPLFGDLSPLEEYYRDICARLRLPSLIIHGARDRLVPLAQGRELFDSIGTEEKLLQVIDRADHNDIMFVDSKTYMDAVEGFINKYS